jgi:hypothetical protein
MRFSVAVAKSLCTKQEFPLVSASFPPEIDALTPAQLTQRVVRARDLNAKFRDLYRAQSRSDQAARGADTARNVRTLHKAQLFGEVRDRFEAKLSDHASTAAV